MTYLKDYKVFIQSYYLTNGLKLTLGILFPSILAWIFGHIPLGIDLSLGSLCISIIDSPGPFQHRRNAMLVGLILLFLSSLVTLFTASTYFQYFIILLLGFLFSFISLYGARAMNIGLCGLLGVIFSLNSKGSPLQNIDYALVLAGGGAWYLVFSATSYRILPFELARKALGDCIFKTAHYIKNRALFYEDPFNEEELIKKSLKDQLEVVEAQNLARELLLKNKDLMKNTNARGRALVLVFSEVLDIFDELSATHADYQLMHNNFSKSGILNEIKEFILEFAAHMEAFAGQVSTHLPVFGNVVSYDTLFNHMDSIREHVRVFNRNLEAEEDIPGLLSIRRVERSLIRSLDRLKFMKQYLTSEGQKSIENLNIHSFVDHQEFSFSLFQANLKISSVFFRHALRLSIALLIALCIMPWLEGHRGYWILLTIVFILKPGFSISKSRTMARLTGTLLGAGLAFILLFFISSPQILFGFLVLFMFLAYSFTNLNYMVSVFSTSIFVLILFHFLYPGNLNFVPDRILDTLIGFCISLACIYLVFPTWEFLGIPALVIKSLEALKNYYLTVLPDYIREGFDLNQYKLARKENYLRLSNLNSALERMSKEPVQKQVHAEEFHKLTILCTQFSSSVAAIGVYLSKNPQIQIKNTFQEFISNTLSDLDSSIQFLYPTTNSSEGNIGLNLLENRPEELKTHYLNQLQDLTHTRFEEIREGKWESETQIQLREFSLLHEHFNYLSRLSEDILQACSKINSKSVALEV